MNSSRRTAQAGSTPLDGDSRPRHFRVRAASVALAAGALALMGCSDDGGTGGTADSTDDATVVATTSIWADVTSQVACGELQVPALIPVGTDAHSFEPSVQDADMLRSASLIVSNGLGLEEGLQDALDTAEQDGVTVVEVGPSLDPIPADQDHDGEEQGGEEQGDTDPHVWMDPDRVAAAVPLIAERLVQIEGLPVSASQVEACAEDYVADLEQLAAEMDTTLSVIAPAQRKLVTNHEALGYFAARFDFEVIGAVVPSTSSLGESNPRELDDLAAAMRDEGVSAVFAESTSATELADALAAQVGSQVRVVELFTESLGGANSGAATYLEMLGTDAELVAGALGSAPGSTGPGSTGPESTEPGN